MMKISRLTFVGRTEKESISILALIFHSKNGNCETLDYSICFDQEALSLMQK